MNTQLLLACMGLLLLSPSHAAFTPTQYQNLLRVGMDVDWLKTGRGRKANYASQQAPTVNVPASFLARGFDHVRLRVKGYNLQDRSTNSAVTLLDEIENTVDECLEAGLTPILAFQAARFKNKPTKQAEKDAVKTWWTTVATRLKQKSYKLSFNLIIETTGAVKKKNDDLNALYATLESAIHAIDSQRILIIAPNKISSPLELGKLVVPDNPYMMVEWHFYAAGPKRTNPKKKWTTGTLAEKKLIKDKVAVAKKWSEDNDIPTWVGAWMPANFNRDGFSPPSCPPGGSSYTIPEMKVFARFMSKTLHCAGIPHAVNSDTKYYSRQDNEWCNAMSPVVNNILANYSSSC